MPYRFFHSLTGISNKVSEVNRISRGNKGLNLIIRHLAIQTPGFRFLTEEAAH